MSEQTFQVGEIALLRPTIANSVAPDLARYVGEKVEVVSPLIQIDPFDFSFSSMPLWFYTVRSSDGHIFAAAPCALQKIPPGQDWVKLCKLDAIPKTGVPA